MFFSIYSRHYCKDGERWCVVFWMWGFFEPDWTVSIFVSIKSGWGENMYFMEQFLPWGAEEGRRKTKESSCGCPGRRVKPGMAGC